MRLTTRKVLRRSKFTQEYSSPMCPWWCDRNTSLLLSQKEPNSFVAVVPSACADEMPGWGPTSVWWSGGGGYSSAWGGSGWSGSDKCRRCGASASTRENTCACVPEMPGWRPTSGSWSGGGSGSSAWGDWGWRESNKCEGANKGSANCGCRKCGRGPSCGEVSCAHSFGRSPSVAKRVSIVFNPFTSKFKKYILPTF